MIKVSITDDHAGSRQSLAKYLENEGFELMAVANSSRELMLTLHPRHLPDIAIINYKTTRPETLIAAEWIKKNYPSVKVMVIALDNIHIPFNKLRSMGIEALIIKSEISMQKLMRIIRGVYNGDIYFPGL